MYMCVGDTLGKMIPLPPHTHSSLEFILNYVLNRDREEEM